MSPNRILNRLNSLLKKTPRSIQLAGKVATGAINSKIGVTCRGKTDGGGAQVLAVMSALAFAKDTGLAYFHTPFSSVAHAEGDPADWTDRWESFFNLGAGERTIGADDERCVEISAFLKHKNLYADQDAIVAAQHFLDYTDRNPDAFLDVVAELRRKYWSQPKEHIPLHKSKNGLTASVHVRRGDVSATHPMHANRFTDDDLVMRTINDIQRVAREAGRQIKVNVYSQGARSSFGPYTDAGCELYLNEDVFETYHNMVCADILVMAKSALSYSAGLLGGGIKIYDPFWHPPMKDWIVRDSAGGIDGESLRRSLGSLRV